MRYLILVLILLPTTKSLSQTKKFDIKDFPDGKFKIRYDTTKMTEFKVVLIVAKPILDSVAQYQGTKVWVQRLKQRNEITEKYLGELAADERGFYREYDQPLNDTFIIVECGEHEGKIYLITKNGDFVTIPGSNYALNKPGLIYTRDSHLDKLRYKFDLNGKKGTDLSGKNESTDGLLFNEVFGSYWVK